MGLRLIPDNVIRLGGGLGGANGLSVVGGGAQQSTLLNGLYAFWKMNESGNVNRADSVGGSTLVKNGTVNDAAGLLGRAAVFTASTSNYLSCADNADISPAGTSFTIALWCKFTTFDNAGLISKFAGAGGNEYIIDVSSTRILRFLHYGFNVGSVSVASYPNDNTTWHAIRAWYNMATSKTYIQFDASAPAEQAVTGAINVSNGPIKFGQFDGSSRPLAGAIDHAGFWKRVLTDAEWLEFVNGGAGVDFIP